MGAEKLLHSLEEEVVHLRQFSMALMRERGDLALHLQRRDEELATVRAQFAKVDAEMHYLRSLHHHAAEADLAPPHVPLGLPLELPLELPLHHHEAAEADAVCLAPPHVNPSTVNRNPYLHLSLHDPRC